MIWKVKKKAKREGSLTLLSRANPQLRYLELIQLKLVTFYLEKTLLLMHLLENSCWQPELSSQD